MTLTDIPLLFAIRHSETTEVRSTCAAAATHCSHAKDGNQKAALDYIRKLFIASLPQVEHFNGSKVTDRARIMAERTFIRAHLYAGPHGAEARDDDPSLPPRYHELVASAFTHGGGAASSPAVDGWAYPGLCCEQSTAKWTAWQTYPWVGSGGSR